MKVQLTIKKNDQRFVNIITLIQMTSSIVDVIPINKRKVILDFEEDDLEEKEVIEFIDDVTSTILQIMNPIDMEIKIL